MDGSGRAETVVDVPAGDAGGQDPRATRRVVVLSATFPLPPDGGNKVMLAGLVHYLVERLGAEHVHYVLVGSVPPGTAASGEDLGSAVDVVDRGSTSERLASVVRHTVLGRSSFQESVLWAGSTAASVDAVLDAVRPDLVVVDTVRVARYLTRRPRTPGTTWICYLDDLFSERYRSMLEIVRDEPDATIRPLASFTSLVPRGFRWLADWAPTQRAILAFEARRVARAEEAAARAFDLCLLANENEAVRLRRRVPGSDVRAVSPVAQIAGAAGVARAYDPRLPPTYVVMGVMSGPHNDLAMRWLVAQVLPILLRTAPDAVIEVLGKTPTPELRSLSRARGDRVRLLGFVPDPRPHLASACALLNPPSYASGIKLKVIDALSVGLPTVSTSAGAEGVDSGRDRGVLVADSAADFAAAMDALRDGAANAAVSTGARRQFAERFSRRAVFDQYDTIFAPAARDRTG